MLEGDNTTSLVVIRVDGKNICQPITRDLVVFELQKLDEGQRSRASIIPVSESGQEILLG